MAPHALSPSEDTTTYPSSAYTSTAQNNYAPSPTTSSNQSSLGSGEISHGFVPMAICGMACRLPGGVNSPKKLWELLVNKGDARSEVPASRYNVEAYHSETDKPGAVKSKYGYFLENDLSSMDTSFFSMSQLELERCDPQQRQMLEVARESLEDAGVTAWRGTKTGVYVGNFAEDWNDMMDKDPQQYGVYRIIGQGDFALANRVSYEMDLRGPSTTIRTACAASLMGLHDACLAIANGDCTAAIVGGASLILTPSMTIKFSEQGALSPDASCKTFSADANGYARAEAISAIYIKPLSDAIRDGNPVRAVIRATATNHDGKTPGITYPGIETQEALIRHAYKTAGITDYSETAFVELHGTGTPVGDPIEANAVARVFGDRGVHITSIKPNVGHSEGASGLSSVIKAVLALENRIIPPNIKFTTPNPKIPWESAKLTVPVEPTPWPATRKERVSVNSFGIGGSNAHIIIDSAASFDAVPVLEEASDAPQLLVYSANTAESLVKLIENYRTYLAKNPERVEDLAYTLANKREHLPHRAFVVASREKPGAPSPVAKPSQNPNLIMVFTGQGAQWPQMGRDLFRSNAVFKASIKAMDQHLKSLGEAGPKWTIEAELRKPAKTSRLDLAELSQPLCTAIQVALVDALAAVGVRPDGVVGHSSGEIAGAYASGALTSEQAITAAFHRGAIAKKQTRKGAMAAIGMGWDDVKPFLIHTVGVACENSPKSVTLSGDADKVEEVVAEISKSKPGVLARMLKVEKAYHSYHMAEVGEDYYRLVGPKMFGKPPIKPFFSSVTGKLLGEGEQLGSRYWQANLESPVLFRSAVSSILEHEVGKNAMFLEIGPHSALAGPLRQILSESSNSAPYVSAMLRGQNSNESLLNAIGKLYTLHVPVDFKALYPQGTTLSELPRYPWNHAGSHWHESRATKEWRMRQHRHHDLLGVKTTESTDYEPVWRNLLHLDNAPWLRDHQVGDDIVFPFAGYVAMAGEAIRQITGIQDGFKVRNTSATTALVTPEGTPVELITTLRKHRLTNSLDSDWWEFTVGSHNGHVWTKHCSGEVKAMPEAIETLADDNTVELPRKLDTRKWYHVVRQGGNSYGPRFQCLDNIATSTVLPGRATASVKNNREGDEASYHIHPTLLDATLQLLVAASALGLGINYRTNVATSVPELSISRTSSDLDAGVVASFAGAGVLGSGTYTANGKVVMRMTDFALTVLDGPKNDDSHAAARHVWKSDIDFESTEDLLKPTVDHSLYSSELENLLQLCLLHSKRAVEGLEQPKLPYLQKYLTWIKAQVPSTGTEVAPENEDLISLIDSQVKSLSETPAGNAALAMAKLSKSIAKILTGELQSHDVLEEDDIFNKVQSLINDFDKSNFLEGLAHSKPNLRVLELGAGTGASTAKILKHLAGSYSKYSFTDFSTNFFNPVKEQFKNVRNIEYLPLDVSKDLEDQDFGDREYDLIVATNVIHETEDISSSLKNARKLLHPRGRLLLQELTPSSKWINYVFGVLPSWWKGLDETRTVEPYIDTKAWVEQLQANDFTVEIKTTGSNEPFQLNTIIVARPDIAVNVSKRVALLRSAIEKDTTEIEQSLRSRGYTVTLLTTDDTPPREQDIFAVLDLDEPFFQSLAEDGFNKLKAFLDGIKEAGIFWVTKPSSDQVEDPRYGQILGFSRTVRNETGLDFAVCQTDSSFSESKVIDVFEKFQSRSQDAVFNAEMEYTVLNGQVNIGRFYPHPLTKELLTTESTDKTVLAIDRPGRLDGLHWERRVAEPAKTDQVEIEVHATGLNYRDVQIATGAEAAEPVFGLEAAGIVRGVGPDVKHLQIGDRVMVFGHNTFSTAVTESESLCIKIPGELGFTDAATLPLAYSTALYSLVNVGGLQEGQSVLIHSAAGAIGLAAIQIARHLGAEIYATVSSEEKVQFLVDRFNIPRHQIFNSRDASFVEGIKRETNNNGVDLVLNSLSGELLHASWRCVAEFGKMVEIGKKDITGAAKLDMDVFLLNRSYASVDINRIRAAKPGVISRLLNSTAKLFSEGYIKPIPVSKTFTAVDIHEAFTYMQQGIHTGKIVVELQTSTEATQLGSGVTERNTVAKFDGAASYLLVGGLGGLGRSVSIWMVEHGARNLIYLSRSAGARPEDKALVHELETMGCNVVLVQGTVTSSEDVTRAIKSSTAPLKGVIQMSMVLRDQGWANMTWDDWHNASAPKVEGTWNLHNATVEAGIDLDFFVLFSSITGVIGNPGQANYASANTFLDAFCQYRTGLGLPASAIDLGVVEDVGVVSTQADLLNQFRAQGFWTLKEKEVLDAFTLATGPVSPKAARSDGAFAHPNTFVIGLASTTPLSSDKNRAVWRRDPRMAAYHNGGGEVAGAASSDNFKSFLASAKADASVLKTAEAEELLATEIAKKVLGLLMKADDEVNTSLGLADLGMDSLIAIDMRMWWKQTFGFDISVLEMLGMGTLEVLGKHAAKGLSKAIHGE